MASMRGRLGELSEDVQTSMAASRLLANTVGVDTAWKKSCKSCRSFSLNMMEHWLQEVMHRCSNVSACVQKWHVALV